jgi:hypothetical protein
MSHKNNFPPVKLNLEGFHRNLRREGTPDRVYYFEHGVAENMQEALNERFGIWRDIDNRSPNLNWDRAIATHRFLGHEYFRIFPEGARIIAPGIMENGLSKGKELLQAGRI